MKKFLLAVSILFLTVFCYSKEYKLPDFNDSIENIVMNYIKDNWNLRYDSKANIYDIENEETFTFLKSYAVHSISLEKVSENNMKLTINIFMSDWQLPQFILELIYEKKLTIDGSQFMYQDCGDYRLVYYINSDNLPRVEIIISKEN